MSKKERNKMYYLKNRDKLIQKTKEWKELNPERKKINARNYYYRHYEKIKVKRIRDRLKKNLYMKRYLEKNRARINKYKALYYNKKHFGLLKYEILDKNNWTCKICNMTNRKHLIRFDKNITIHHIDGNGRYSENPNNSPDNLEVLCLSCHAKEDWKRIKMHKTSQALG